MNHKLSVIFPCFNEEDNIAPALQALDDLALGDEYEVEAILVDDGSSDDTWKNIRSATLNNGIVRGVRLSRNFGQQAALLAGLRVAAGDAVITMDVDLQHPPSLIPKMLARWMEGAEMVLTIRQPTGELSFFKRLTSRCFYGTFRLLTGLPLTPGQADYRLFDKKVVKAMLSFRESGMFLRGLVSWIGFKQEKIPYVADSRHAGDTKYTLRKMVQLAIDGMFSFSNVPLRMGLALGVVTTAMSLLYGAYALLVWLIARDAFGALVPHWSSLGAILLFPFGLLFIELGLLGEYLARVYVESKGRPQYIVAETTKGKAEE